MEAVQIRMEDMTEEVEQMKRTKLFTYTECKEILKKRKQFEYKINGFSKNLQDFLDYIEYERDLFETVRLRRNSMRIGEKMNYIEHKILNRIKGLYEIIIERFPDNTTQFLAYFKFCKQAKYVSAASVAVSNMIKCHSHNIEIWQVAAKWHAYDRNDISTALKILYKGLAKHKDSKLLYTEVIQLEIRNAIDGNWQGNNNENKVVSEKRKKLCLEKLQTYFNEIASNIDDCAYYVEILEYLEEYQFTEPVQKVIVNHLVNNYSSKALTWDMLAQRDRKGLPTSTDVDSKADVTATTKMKLTKCIQRYKEGLPKVSKLEKEQLWSLYINCLLDARQEEPGVANLLKTNSLKEAFEKASEENFLFEKYYIQWLELADDSEKPKIMEKATARFPQSVDLWKFHLKIAMLTDDKEYIKKVYTAGARALKEKALPLWTGFVRYHLLSSDDNTIEAIYKEGVKQPPQISDVLKPDYIEWLAVTKSTAYTREQYFTLAHQEPYCKELHNTMFKLETTELNMDYDMCDTILELACKQFGKEDVEVWQNRMQYYVGYKQGKVSKETFEKTLKAAEEALPPVLFSDFKAKYYAMAVDE